MATLTYTEAYEKGWRAAARTSDLDSAEDRFESRYGTDKAQWNAWMDGYLDQAAGRAKWHLRDCPDHNSCGEA